MGVSYNRYVWKMLIGRRYETRYRYSASSGNRAVDDTYWSHRMCWKHQVLYVSQEWRLIAEHSCNAPIWTARQIRWMKRN